MPIVTTHSVGRLMEVRFTAPIVAADLERFTRERREAAQRIHGGRVVCADLRDAAVLPLGVTDGIVHERRGVDEPVRNALLMPPGRATMAMQMERMLREMKSPSRRVFHDRDALVAWLDEVLEPAERTRLRAFLDER